MSRTLLKNKAVLVLGADSPIGRSISLQLSREGAKTIIAGHEKEQLALLAEFLVAKGGAPTAVDLSPGVAEAAAAVREARDTLGHVHVVVNALPAMEGLANAEDQTAELSTALGDVLKGRGQLRQVTIWPDSAGPMRPEMGIASWHCVLRLRKGASHSERPEEEPEALKAAGVADTVVCLLQCPPAACPVEVRLEERELKS